MVTDIQVKKLKKYLSQGKTLEVASAKAGMDEKTGRKYRDLNKLPSELRDEYIRNWRTRPDPLAGIWDKALPFLENNEGLEAKALFEHLQRTYPNHLSDGQLRTFQRRVKQWQAISGHSREVYFPQSHKPGKLSQSDFTHMANLHVTLGGQPFDHLIYHFVLTYSNWETGNICYSESFESLSEGLQRSFWQLGGVPRQHQTDRLSTAVNKPDNPEEFTRYYQALLNYYKVEGRKTNPASPHENGDIEQRHHRFKRALDQALMIRGSRDFTDQKEYEDFLEKLFRQLNCGRKERFSHELEELRPLPSKRLDTCTRLDVRVGPSSTIRVKHQVYSVNSRLIKEIVTVKLYTEHLEVWYGQYHIETIPRIRGKSHYIQYRHIIDWLVRKPGAFENYRYRKDLFPTSRFRAAYDSLAKRHTVRNAGKEYLLILQLAAKENETGVDNILWYLLDNNISISFSQVVSLFRSGMVVEPTKEVKIAEVKLSGYDQLLQEVYI